MTMRLLALMLSAATLIVIGFAEEVLVAAQGPDQVAGSSYRPVTYGPAEILQEDVDGSIVDLLPAYANIDNLENVLGSFYIHKEENTYYLWLSTRDRRGSLSNSYSIEQRFESQDGLVWRNRTDTNLALSGAPYRFVDGLREIIKTGNTYEGWDSYYYEWSSGWGWAVRYVTSNDGLNWTVVNQPALIGARYQNVIRDGNTYRMWVHPFGDSNYHGTRSLRYRISDSGGSGWGHWQTGGTLVNIDGSEESRDKSRIRRLIDGTYELFYADGNSINVASSSDGINFTTQVTGLLDYAELLSSNYLIDFAVLDVNGQDWFYFTYCETLYPSGFCQHSRIAVSRPVWYTYLPQILRNYTPPATFPIYISDNIPVRGVAYPGEIFFTGTVRLPAELPTGGHFYFSSQPAAVTKVLVDDSLVMLQGDKEVFSYNFSTNGQPVPTIVEVPRTTIEQLAGQTIKVQYRDVYGYVVEASEMWLIWTP